jgi:Lipocalin-like domain
MKAAKFLQFLNHIFMTNTLKTALWALLCSAFLFSACKKDEKDHLTSTGCWKQVKSESKDLTTGAWTEDVIDACDKDDCLSFSDDGKTTFDEGATKCDPDDPQTSSGTWSLSDDKKTLTVVDPVIGGFAFAVSELSKDKMVVTGNLFFIEVRWTFEAQ